MIKLIIGGIGSGKSVTAVKEIVNRNTACFTNFPINHPKATRLKEDHILLTKIETTARGKEKKTVSINWDFWQDLKDRNIHFDIYLDEVHNVLNARKSMAKWNTLFTTWLSQIRKLLGDSEQNHIYMISQRLTGIDVIARDLANEIIYCSKMQHSTGVWIFKTIFRGTYCLEKFTAYMQGDKTYDGKKYYRANPYFKYYDSYNVVRFGESVYI